MICERLIKAVDVQLADSTDVSAWPCAVFLGVHIAVVSGGL